MDICEENFREAACNGDKEALVELIKQNVDINCKNKVNGWTALHWACKRGNDDIVQMLVYLGADTSIVNQKGETPSALCSKASTLELLGCPKSNLQIKNNQNENKFVPNYIKHPPLNGQVDVTSRRSRHPDLTSMPTTILPSLPDDDLILRVRIANSSDPDFIEVEIPRWKLTYGNVLHICCEELECSQAQVERVRKLPNTRLRKDSEMKRLTNYQALELVLKPLITSEKSNNCYQSISTCKDQTILY